MNLVVGATGMVGSEICNLLIKAGKPVRAMVRETSNQTKIENLKELGVEIVKGNLRDSSTFGQAFEGVTNVITTVSSMPFSYSPGENDIQTTDLDGMIYLIDSAKASGVKHFIYTSFSEQINLDFPLENAKRSVEKHLQNSGMNYTILRPSYFMEIWLSPAVGFDAANAKVQICGEGNKPVSYISYKDVAKFAVKSLENTAARNTYLEIGGPEKLSQLDAVKIFEEINNKKFEIQNVPIEVLKSQLEAASDPMQKSFTGLMICIAQGDPINMDETLKTFPMQLTSVKNYAVSL